MYRQNHKKFGHIRSEMWGINGFNLILKFHAVRTIDGELNYIQSEVNTGETDSMNPASLSILRVVCLAGLISLLHCAYSAAQVCWLRLMYFDNCKILFKFCAPTSH